MRTNLSQANSARQQKALNQKYCFRDYGIKSFLQLIEEGIITGAKITMEPSVRYNRIKYNRMDWNEQMAYEQKLNTKVKVYNLCTSKDSSFTVPKMVYDYFIASEYSKKCQFV